MRYRYWIAIGASIILGLIFVIAGLGKLPQQAELLAFILPRSFLTPTLAKIVAHYLPWVELTLGSLLIIGIAIKFMTSFSSVLIAAFIANNSWMISHGLGREPCGCPGQIENVVGTMSVIDSLYLDIGLVALVVSVILLFYPGNLSTIHPWFLTRGKIDKKKNWIGSG